MIPESTAANRAGQMPPMSATTTASNWYARTSAVIVSSLEVTTSSHDRSTDAHTLADRPTDTDQTEDTDTRRNAS